MIVDHDNGDEDAASPELSQAIRLRELTRIAIARWDAGVGDLDEVVRLNALADAAYERLGPFEATAYLAWARSMS